MAGGNKNPAGPAQQHGGGFFQPGVMTIDPTPEHLKGLQQAVSQALMGRMQQSAQQRPMPTFGQMQGMNPLLYGGQQQGPIPSASSPGPQLMRATGGMPMMNSVNPMQSPAQMPTYGDIVSGSRMIRSMQPQFTNQFSVPPIIRRGP